MAVMQNAISYLALSLLVFGLSSASPTPNKTPEAQALEERQLFDGIVNDLLNGANGALNGVLNTIENVASGNAGGNDPYANILDALRPVERSAPPDSIEAAFDALQDIIDQDPPPPNLYAIIGEMVAAGLTSDSVGDLLGSVQGASTGQNSHWNSNRRRPSPRAYPRANRRDARYRVSEWRLRAAIYIPSSFQYGRQGAPQPAILVPGTGNTGYKTFVGNYIPLLQDSQIADPVWLNIPGYQLNDAQTNVNRTNTRAPGKRKADKT